jgi:hypothetical protein
LVSIFETTTLVPATNHSSASKRNVNGKKRSSMTNYREILDRALASPKGLRVEFESKALAIRFRDRCNKLRASDRKLDARARDKGHGDGVSQFDGLVLRLEKPEERVLLIEHEGSLQPVAVHEIGTIPPA